MHVGMPKTDSWAISIHPKDGEEELERGGMFEIVLLTGLGYTPSSGSWTRNLLPDGWKNGSGGNSQ